MADTAWIAAGTAVLGFAIGYFIRRSEHLREQRLDAYRRVLATFVEAARTGASLQVVHARIGYPDRLTGSLEPAQIERMKQVHADSWERANASRNAFYAALYGVDLVASPQPRGMLEDLRGFLDDALYSGDPWVRGASDFNNPIAGLNPGAVEARALETARPFIERARVELWGVRLRGRRGRRPK